MSGFVKRDLKLVIIKYYFYYYVCTHFKLKIVTIVQVTYKLFLFDLLFLSRNRHSNMATTTIKTIAPTLIPAIIQGEIIPSDVSTSANKQCCYVGCSMQVNKNI